MNPMVLLLIGGAGFLLYNYFQTPDGPTGPMGPGLPQPTPVGSGQQTVQGTATSPTTTSQVESLAEQLEAFAGGSFNHGGNFWEWDYYMQRLKGKSAPDPTSLPMFQGMSVQQIQSTPITAGQFVAMTSNSGLGMVWSTPGRYLSLADRGLGGNGPSGFERLSTTFRRIN